MLALRLLGEDLVAFRDTRGDLGLVEEQCPHRGASLFYGRNEGCGLRCTYHGWKFDVHGQCVDQRSERHSFAHRITITSHPVRESGGIVWAYLGPAAAMTPFRDFGTDKPGYPSGYMSMKFWRHDPKALIEVHDTWHGFRYAGIRDTPNGYRHARITAYIFPASNIIAQIRSAPGRSSWCRPTTTPPTGTTSRPSRRPTRAALAARRSSPTRITRSR